MIDRDATEWALIAWQNMRTGEVSYGSSHYTVSTARRWGSYNNNLMTDTPFKTRVAYIVIVRLKQPRYVIPVATRLLDSVQPATTPDEPPLYGRVIMWLCRVAVPATVGAMVAGDLIMRIGAVK